MTRPHSSSATASSSRRLTHLPPKLDAQLLAYAAAATAAGVGLFTQSAEAKIVYTAANVNIPYNTNVPIDLNNDGTADFLLFMGFNQDARRYPEGGFASWLDIYPETGNGVWAAQTAKFVCAAALPAGVPVGKGKELFSQDYLPLWQKSGSYTRGVSERCPWAGKHRGAFLGLRFIINHEVHYGWAHVTVGSATTLDGYAYETVPNQPIDTGKTSGPDSVALMDRTPPPAPQPAGVGLLAQGSRGLAIWRKPEENQA